MSLVRIPIGHIWDIASGNATRRWRAEQALRRLWAGATSEQRQAWLKELGAYPTPSPENDAYHLLRTFAEEDDKKRKSQLADERFRASLRKPVDALAAQARDGTLMVEEIVSQANPLLEELFPDKSPQERASVLVLFAGAHERKLEDLDDPCLDELFRTLRYYVDYTRGNMAGSPRVGDMCQGCQEFKASMFELFMGVGLRHNEQGFISPLRLDDPSATDDFNLWVVEGTDR